MPISYCLPWLPSDMWMALSPSVTSWYWMLDDNGTTLSEGEKFFFLNGLFKIDRYLDRYLFQQWAHKQYNRDTNKIFNNIFEHIAVVSHSV